MSDRHFDELATRFAEKIYGGAKGAIRLAALQADPRRRRATTPATAAGTGPPPGSAAFPRAWTTTSYATPSASSSINVACVRRGRARPPT
ncbi:hypothetical protein G039_0322975 [Pseudomonas aeruginosa VRFPA01]|nr:hypothetical protein G039_0322975 [Pseudomonas aeruginosa VRFPA01]